MTEIVFDRSDNPHEMRRLKAAREIADSERAWSAARSLTEREGREHTTEQHLARLAVQQVFYELTELQEVPEDALPALLEIFATDANLLNLTLGRLEMAGEWEETRAFERELFSQLYDANYKNITWIRREDPEAKINITIPAGFTDEMGFVALQRKRRLIMANHIDGADAARPMLQVDKISTFALDITALQQVDDAAAAEVRLIVAMTMFRALNLAALSRFYEELQHDEDAILTVGKYLYGTDSKGIDAIINSGDVGDYFKYDDSHWVAVQQARVFDAAIRRHNISLADIRARIEHPEPVKLHNPTGVAFVEEAIRKQSKLLTPAITTYYAH